MLLKSRKEKTKTWIRKQYGAVKELERPISEQFKALQDLVLHDTMSVGEQSTCIL